MTEYKLPASKLAQAWKVVSMAAEDSDKSRPVLYRTTHIEFMAGGIQLVATDSYILMRAFVPFVGGEASDGMGEPEMTRTVADPARRVASLLAHAGKTAGHAGHVIVSTGDEADGALGGKPRPTIGFISEGESITVSSATRASNDYLNWRGLHDGSNNPVKAINLGPAVLTRLAKLPFNRPGDGVAMRFTSESGVVAFDVTLRAPGVTVSGLLMPVRNKTT